MAETLVLRGINFKEIFKNFLSGNFITYSKKKAELKKTNITTFYKSDENGSDIYTVRFANGCAIKVRTFGNPRKIKYCFNCKKKFMIQDDIWAIPIKFEIINGIKCYTLFKRFCDLSCALAYLRDINVKYTTRLSIFNESEQYIQMIANDAGIGPIKACSPIDYLERFGGTLTDEERMKLNNYQKSILFKTSEIQTFEIKKTS